MGARGIFATLLASLALLSLSTVAGAQGVPGGGLEVRNWVGGSRGPLHARSDRRALHYEDRTHRRRGGAHAWTLVGRPRCRSHAPGLDDLRALREDRGVP